MPRRLEATPLRVGLAVTVTVAVAVALQKGALSARLPATPPEERSAEERSAGQRA